MQIAPHLNGTLCACCRDDAEENNWHAIKRVLAERRSQAGRELLVDWLPSRSGVQYSPQWVPEQDVDSESRAQWDAQRVHIEKRRCASAYSRWQIEPQCQALCKMHACKFKVHAWKRYARAGPHAFHWVLGSIPTQVRNEEVHSSWGLPEISHLVSPLP